jgi:hypothetical protein
VPRTRSAVDLGQAEVGVVEKLVVAGTVLEPASVPENRRHLRGGLRVFVPHWLSNPRTFMQVFLSVGLAGASVFVILSEKFDASSVQWAFGMLTLIVGYWMRGSGRA